MNNTLIGKTFSSRVAASVLNAAGIPELIAKSLNEYEKIAIDVALNKEKLLKIKENLKDKSRNGLLFDSVKFTKDLEEIYLKIN